MGFGIGSSSTSERFSFFDDRSKLQHKQEFPTNGNNQSEEYPRNAKKQTKAKVMCFLKKIGL